MPILVFLGLSVLELFPMYATDRRQTDRQTDRHQTKASLNASALTGRGIMTMYHCRFLNIEAGILFSRPSERDLKDFADGFFFCHWRHGNSSITVKCVFVSAFLLHPRGSPATSVYRESPKTPFPPHGIPAQSAGSLPSLSPCSCFITDDKNAQKRPRKTH